LKAILEEGARMKKCPKCNKKYPDSSTFCTACGTKLIAVQEERFCAKCGNKLTAADKFCSKCGTAVAEAATDSPVAVVSDDNQPIQNTDSSTVTDKQVDIANTANIAPNPTTESATFSFSSGRNPYRDPFPTVTEIKAEKNILTVRQYKTYIFIKFNDHTNIVDINSITNLMKKEEVNKKNIFWVIFAGLCGIATISNGSPVLGIVILIGAAGIAKCLLHKKTLFMYFNNGYARIPEEDSEEGDVAKLVDYIGQYNPKCVKVEL